MSISRSSSISQSNLNAPKTSLIISNLHKDDFIKISNNEEPKLITKSLSLVDQIKLSVLNSSDDIIQYITHWSNLPFLYRIIIIFKNETKAKEILTFLKQELSNFPYIKLSLQENLLSRSKSQDYLVDSNSSNSNLNVTLSLDNFRNFHNDPKNEFKNFEYIEPEPAQFNVLSDLSKLGINVRDFNSDEQINELKEDEKEDQERMIQNRKNSISRSNSLSRNNSFSPTRQPPVSRQQSPAAPSSPNSFNSSNTNTTTTGVERRRSTKTLFKPELKLKTSGNDIPQPPTPISKFSPQKEDYPSSPTITLDETF
ncbi:uncharacterized protein KGF55_005038 [Candida pseudojiufengensis]|uniref:uncharacterized protein n=1 Tax=Candida pseudojiufengensis TaxID=497109 RepID=UPI0022258324|nr:uncharacterized protein KGF55_005038 [Candida pseudojiufengensis]KAI5959806.1 hypothetical protein KGF55_005038 [Candida pseudojiufengensis]